MTVPFPPAEARRLVEQFERHYTPKHVGTQHPVEPVPRSAHPRHADVGEVAAWQKDRNKNHTKADWQFTTADAASS